MAIVLTNKGKEILVDRIMGNSTEPKNGAWGTGAGTSDITDTTLFTEATEGKVAGTSSKVTTTTTNDTYQVVVTMTADGTKTITNAGLFNTAVELFIKADFTGLALAVGDSITFTFKIKMG
jgi:hypothetical protein